MDSYQVVAGLSDIKSELVIKTGTSNALSEVQLWFSFEDGVLYVHDFNDHTKCIVLAILQVDGRWVYFLRPNSYGLKLVEETTTQKLDTPINEALHEIYKSHGFVPT